jgi:hypothetical protein
LKPTPFPHQAVREKQRIRIHESGQSSCPT